jgi:hypothetical protein
VCSHEYMTKNTLNSRKIKQSRVAFAIDDVSITTPVFPTCSGTFYDTGGSSGDYSINEDYTTTYCANYGQNIRFTFTAFETGDKDYLRIYDGETTSSPSLGNFSKNTSPGA